MQQLKSSLTSTVWSTCLRATLALAVLVAPRVAHCEEADDPPVFTHLQVGETAPFQGYLLSPEAVGQVVTVDDERRLKEIAQLKLVFDEERASLDRDLKLRDARIARLEGEALVIADVRAKETAAYKEEVKRLRGRVVLYAIIGALAGGATAGVIALL